MIRVLEIVFSGELRKVRIRRILGYLVLRVVGLKVGSRGRGFFVGFVYMELGF